MIPVQFRGDHGVWSEFTAFLVCVTHRPSRKGLCKGQSRLTKTELNCPKSAKHLHDAKEQPLERGKNGFVQN